MLLTTIMIGVLLGSAAGRKCLKCDGTQDCKNGITLPDRTNDSPRNLRSKMNEIKMEGRYLGEQGLGLGPGVRSGLGF